MSQCAVRIRIKTDKQQTQNAERIRGTAMCLLMLGNSFVAVCKLKKYHFNPITVHHRCKKNVYKMHFLPSMWLL